VTPTFGLDALHATHLNCLLDSRHPPPVPDAQKTLKLARKYASESTDVNVWLLRIEAEKRYSPGTNSISELTRKARSRVRGPGMEKIWVSGWEELNIIEQEVSFRQDFVSISLFLCLGSPKRGILPKPRRRRYPFATNTLTTDLFVPIQVSKKRTCFDPIR
jgi:hypothetical protein